MKLRLITDGEASHAVVTDTGEIVERVSEATVTFGANHRPTATIRLHGLDVEIRRTSEVPRLRSRS